MASEFDALIKELQIIQEQPARAEPFTKALPSPRRSAAPIDFGKMNASIKRAESALAAMPATKATPGREEKWRGFFKSLAGVHETFGARVAAGGASAMEVCKIEAKLHRIANKATELMARGL